MRFVFGLSIVSILIAFFHLVVCAEMLIGIEAEQADKLEPLMEVQEDENASGGKFIVTPGFNAPRNRGWALYNVEIPEADEYVVWGRTLSLTSDQDSFYITFDADNIPFNGEFTWCTPKSPDWTWNLANWTNIENSPPQIFELAQGKHELRIWAREAGTQLDCLYITNDQKLSEGDLPMPVEVTPRPKNVRHTGKLSTTWGHIRRL